MSSAMGGAMSEAPTPGARNAWGPNAWGLRGHDAAVEALRRAIRSGHLAHAYLIGGPSGVGKTALARRLAATLVAPSAADPTVPDLDTRAARQIEAGSSPDVERIAIGGMCDESQHDHAGDRSTRIRICQVRRLERVSSLAPFAAPFRVFIIDTADDLQTEAAHAILKTLEEPPPSARFILVAADPDALLPTIRSRCQEFTLRPLPHHHLAAALQEDAALPAAEAAALAHLAHGRYGLAMRMHADPTMAVLRESAEAEVLRLATGSRNERFDVADRLGNAWYRERESVLATIDLWREWWRDALLAGAGVERGVEGASANIDCNAADALRALRAVQTAREHLLANTSAQLALEVMMLDLPTLPLSMLGAASLEHADGTEDRVAATAGG
ncbi:MAG: AAA family ATPase [Dehalococcoidia bacterium]|nr:AAA family ATPase [Dehalococcoidia bacterium]